MSQLEKENNKKMRKMRIRKNEKRNRIDGQISLFINDNIQGNISDKQKEMEKICFFNADYFKKYFTKFHDILSTSKSFHMKIQTNIFILGTSIKSKTQFLSL